MHPMRNYYGCLHSPLTFQNVKDCRLFAEKILAEAHTYPSRFLVNTTGATYNYAYTANKKEKYDDIPFSDCELVMFSGTDKKKSVAFECEVAFFLRSSRQSPNPYKYTTVVFDSRATGSDFDGLVAYAKKLQLMLREVSKIQYLMADCMEADKWASFFLMGVGHNLRTDFENEVAFNIGRRQLIPHKLPFLFLYNYFFGEVDVSVFSEKIGYIYNKHKQYHEVIFPDCFGKLLDDYHNSPAWLKVCNSLREADVIDFSDRFLKVLESRNDLKTR